MSTFLLLRGLSSVVKQYNVKIIGRAELLAQTNLALKAKSFLSCDLKPIPSQRAWSLTSERTRRVRFGDFGAWQRQGQGGVKPLRCRLLQPHCPG